MSDFLLVLGDDPIYKGTKAFCFLHKGIIREIIPLWAVESRGRLWQCTADFVDKKSGNAAKIHAFRVIAMNNQEYSCSVARIKTILDEQEWAILTGEGPEKDDRYFGFRMPEKKQTQGRDVTSVALELVERGLKEPADGLMAKDLTPEQRLQEFESWVRSHPKVDVVLDVSRESIYEGRGE